MHLKKKRAERAKHTTPPKKKRVKRTPARAHPCQPVLHTRIVYSEHQMPSRAALFQLVPITDELCIQNHTRIVCSEHQRPSRAARFQLVPSFQSVLHTDEKKREKRGETHEEKKREQRGGTHEEKKREQRGGTHERGRSERNAANHTKSKTKMFIT